MKKQVAEVATWLSTARKQTGWTVEELLSKAASMAADFRWEGEFPGLSDVEALERAECKAVPRWFKLIRYVFDQASSPNASGLSWLEERNYYFSKEPLGMARPLLFEDEARFINSLDRLEEDHRRALRAFATNFATRQCYEPKEAFAKKLLDKFGIEVTVLDPQECELVECFQKLDRSTRIKILETMREATKIGGY